MKQKTGMGSHQSAIMGKDEWLTDPKILRALGPFDLDPCAPVSRPWEMAKKHYTKHDNGLLQPWEGRVWCNLHMGMKRPYGCRKWLFITMAQHCYMPGLKQSCILIGYGNNAQPSCL